jgi:hypothetical protein
MNVKLRSLNAGSRMCRQLHCSTAGHAGSYLRRGGPLLPVAGALPAACLRQPPYRAVLHMLLLHARVAVFHHLLWQVGLWSWGVGEGAGSCGALHQCLCQSCSCCRLVFAAVLLRSVTVSTCTGWVEGTWHCTGCAARAAAAMRIEQACVT